MKHARLCELSAYFGPDPDNCQVPPPGWWCSREPGHGGPCAAREWLDDPRLEADTGRQGAEPMIGMEHTDVITELAIEAEELARQQEREDAELVLLQHRAVRALNDAPTLIGYVRSLIVPGGGGSDGMPRQVSKDPPAPLRLEPTDDADEFYAQLIDWVTFWGGVLGRPVPASARAARVLADGEVQGFRGHTTPEGARMLVSILAVQLKVWGREITVHESARVFYADVVAMVNVLRGRYPMSPRGERPVSPRPCPVCGIPAVGAVWGSENVRDVLVVCANCGHQVEVKGFSRILDWVVS